VVDTDRGLLAGATIVSPRAGEIIGELTLALRAAVPVSVLADTIHAFPTFSRVLQGALDKAR
jgi:pyruvate/2-oxoglutarate dehydrogenase complex dihydrolipoamide dehydrogenase (E3) component